MFFVMGIYDKVKDIAKTSAMEICENCGRYCTYRVFVRYMCLSLFFVPVLKWNKKYYMETSCCKHIREIHREKGKEFEKRM